MPNHHRAAGLLATAGLLAGLLGLTAHPTTTAETPEERCRRETQAYNAAWRHQWESTHPDEVALGHSAPPPPVPYRCFGGPENTPTPTPLVPGQPNNTNPAPGSNPNSGLPPAHPAPGSGLPGDPQPATPPPANGAPYNDPLDYRYNPTNPWVPKQPTAPQPPTNNIPTTPNPLFTPTEPINPGGNSRDIHGRGGETKNFDTPITDTYPQPHTRFRAPHTTPHQRQQQADTLRDYLTPTTPRPPTTSPTNTTHHPFHPLPIQYILTLLIGIAGALTGRRLSARTAPRQITTPVASGSPRSGLPEWLPPTFTDGTNRELWEDALTSPERIIERFAALHSETPAPQEIGPEQTRVSFALALSPGEQLIAHPHGWTVIDDHGNAVGAIARPGIIATQTRHTQHLSAKVVDNTLVAEVPADSGNRYLLPPSEISTTQLTPRVRTGITHPHQQHAAFSSASMQSGNSTPDLAPYVPTHRREGEHFTKADLLKEHTTANGEKLRIGGDSTSPGPYTERNNHRIPANQLPQFMFEPGTRAQRGRPAKPGKRFILSGEGHVEGHSFLIGSRPQYIHPRPNDKAVQDGSLSPKEYDDELATHLADKRDRKLQGHMEFVEPTSSVYDTSRGFDNATKVGELPLEQVVACQDPNTGNMVVIGDVPLPVFVLWVSKYHADPAHLQAAHVEIYKSTRWQKIIRHALMPRVRLSFISKTPQSSSNPYAWTDMNNLRCTGILNAGIGLREMTIKPIPKEAGGGVVYMESNSLGIWMRITRDPEHLMLAPALNIMSGLFSPKQLINTVRAVGNEQTNDVTTGTTAVTTPQVYGPEIYSMNLSPDGTYLEIHYGVSFWINIIPGLGETQLYGADNLVLTIPTYIIKGLPHATP